MTKTFLTRTLSAIVALAIFVAIYYFLNVAGLKLVCYLAVLVGGFELTRILLPKETGKLHKILFYVTLFLIFHTAANYASFAVAGFSFLTVLFLVFSIWAHASFKELECLVRYQTTSVLGFVYVGLLPSYTYRLLDLNHGLIWFFTLLAIVFTGDVGAYLVGVLFGKHKINPRVSPNKTWEGSFGGLIGSLLAGYVCSQFLPQIPLYILLSLAAYAGLIAQFGDFFESLIKRVANVKDSGSLMPGHGGVLDRLDGVLFASPIILIVASLFEA